MTTVDEVKLFLPQRLRCVYPVGPILPNGEPEFGWRDNSGAKIQQTLPSSIMLEAAGRIEQLEKAIQDCLKAFNGREYEMGERCIYALGFIKQAVGEES